MLQILLDRSVTSGIALFSSVSPVALSQCCTWWAISRDLDMVPCYYPMHMLRGFLRSTVHCYGDEMAPALKKGAQMSGTALL